MLQFHTIKWLDGKLEILDQTLLPGQEQYVLLKDFRDVVRAIKSLQLRGAPLIGVAAAYAVVNGCDFMSQPRRVCRCCQ